MPRLKSAKNTQQKKKCVKGFPCGYSCQPQGRNCKKILEGQAATYQDWLKLKGSNLSEPPTQQISNLLKTEAVVSNISKTDEDLSKIPRFSGQTDFLVSTKRISGIGASNPSQIESEVKKVISGQPIDPMILLSDGIDKYRLAAGNLSANAYKRAKEIEPRKFELSSAIIAVDSKQSDHFNRQLELLNDEKYPNGEYEMLSNGPDSRLVSVKRIKSKSNKKYNPKIVEELAKEILLGGRLVKPIAVRRTKADGSEYKLVGNGLGFAAMQRAREINPRAAELVHSYVMK